MSRQVLNISIERDSSTSLDNLFQCSITSIINNFFCMFVQNFLCSSFRPLLLVLSLHTPEIDLSILSIYFVLGDLPCKQRRSGYQELCVPSCLQSSHKGWHHFHGILRNHNFPLYNTHLREKKINWSPCYWKVGSYYKDKLTKLTTIRCCLT